NDPIPTAYQASGCRIVAGFDVVACMRERDRSAAVVADQSTDSPPLHLDVTGGRCPLKKGRTASTSIENSDQPTRINHPALNTDIGRRVGNDTCVLADESPCKKQHPHLQESQSPGD